MHVSPTIAGAETRTTIARDPAIVAIEKYWKAVTDFRVENVRFNRLVKKLGPDICREPCVFSHRSGGADIFRYRDFEIDRPCDSRIAYVKLSFANRPEDMAQEIAAEEAFRAELKRGLAEDTKSLREKQLKSGYLAALEVRQRAFYDACSYRHGAFTAKPSTRAGALALLRLISDAVRSSSSARSDSTSTVVSATPWEAAEAARHAAKILGEAK